MSGILGFLHDTTVRETHDPTVATTPDPCDGGMNLQHITTNLDNNLRRHLRRTDTLQQWAEHDPRLASSVGALYAQIRDLDRDVSHPVLAALVDLAKNGDNDAAQLVTVALLQRFADKERTKGGAWEQFPGHLYEAIATCHSTRSRCLREIIERNALRRNLKDRIAGADDIQLTHEELLVSVTPTPEDVVIHTDQRRSVRDRLDELVQQRALSETSQRILEHIIAGTDRSTIPELQDRPSNTARTRCRRVAQGLRDNELRTHLIDIVA